MQQYSTRRRVRNALLVTTAVACLGGGIAFATANDSPDPDSTLSPAAREAKYDGAFDDFKTRWAAWLKTQPVQSLDLSKLPQEEMPDEGSPEGYATLEDAEDHATLAVLGTVEAVDFTTAGAVTQFRVEDKAKGDPPGDVIAIKQSAVLYPDESFKNASLRVHPSNEFLQEGDRAVLLLNELTPEAAAEVNGDSSGGGASSARVSKPVYGAQTFSGEYKISKGKIKVNKKEKNKIRDVDGKSEKDVMDRLKAHENQKAGK